MVTTPDVESDVVARLAQLLPAHYDDAGEGRNVWPGPEVPPGKPFLGAQVRDHATFVQKITGRTRIYGGGQWREIDVMLLMRFERGGERAAEARARATYDALHLSPFTGASGQVYTDVRALDEPEHLDDRYYMLNVTLWMDA